MTDSLIEVNGLVKHFPVAGVAGLRLRGLRLGKKAEVVHAVEDVNLTIRRGEFLALVGESGSGKTTLANCIAGFLDPTAGSIYFEGAPLVEVRNRSGRHPKGHPSLRRGTRVVRSLSRRAMATKIQMVFQDPSSALNPRQAIGSTLMEPLLVHEMMPKQQAQARVSELLELVGIPPSMRDRYPHELNSGQRQRVVIARTLTLNPEVLVADEPVSRLDVSMQSQILNLLLTLHRDLALTLIFITHDLSVVRQVADRVVVMYLGRIMETCSADAFFARPSHPYSQALVTSTPRFLGEAESMPVLQGEIPSPIHPPPGCPFATRCPEVVDACNAGVPLLHEVAPGQAVACIRRTASTDAVQVASPQPAQPMS